MQMFKSKNYQTNLNTMALCKYFQTLLFISIIFFLFLKKINRRQLITLNDVIGKINTANNRDNRGTIKLRNKND